MIILNEICGYLPHEILIFVEKDFAERDVNGVLKLNGVMGRTIGYSTLNEGIKIGGITLVQYIKPILRPLSDLTKEIEINGEKFVPIESLLEILDNPSIACDAIIEAIEVLSEYPERANLMPYPIVLKLHEFHFWLGDQDRFGKDIIDINTL
jgi:hypothetical protein